MEPIRGGIFGSSSPGFPGQAPAAPPMPAAGLGLDAGMFSRLISTPDVTRAMAEQEPETSNRRWWVVGGLVVAAIAAGVGIAFWMRHKKQQEEKEEKAKARKSNRMRRANPGKKRAPYRLKPAMNVQTLIFPKAKFTRASAIAWAAKHGHKSDSIDETKQSYRLRQQQPGRVGPKTFRTIAFGVSGIKAVVAKTKQYKKAA